MIYVYDLETYPNFFSCVIQRFEDGARWVFEISDRKHQGVELSNFLNAIMNDRMCGFNNFAFDYPILHRLITNYGDVNAMALYEKAQSIIDGDSFDNIIWQPIIPQIDLYKIHHFDNRARSTSLKMLQFNMRSDSVEDLPIPPGTYINDQEYDIVLNYNIHDVTETVKFLEYSLERLAFRDELTEKYGIDFTNFNDTKIGKKFFIMELEKNGVQCFDDNKQPIQTWRECIRLNDCILDWIGFDTQDFNRLLYWLRNQTITDTKGVFTDVSTSLNGFTYDLGTGGIHGSVHKQIIYSDISHIIIDLDVKSYYPNLAISNGFYPEHLSNYFCTIYKNVYDQRQQYKKGTAENAMLKLALNGVYGDSNSVYSPFYDPRFTMQITLNGQLLLLKLAEMISGVQGLEMIQINTDGLTVRIPRKQHHTLLSIARIWEQLTGLELESVEYSRMFIRDVNNYIAEYGAGGVKRKGAYCYGDDLDWSQNHSAQVIQRAVEAHLINGEDITAFIHQWRDPFDFMLRTKVPRSSQLIGEHFTGEEYHLQNITRYYIALRGIELVKVMPPTPNQLAKNPDAPHRRIGINKGWLVQDCNRSNQFDWSNVNYDFYITESRKLLL